MTGVAELSNSAMAGTALAAVAKTLAHRVQRPGTVERIPLPFNMANPLVA